MTIENSEDATQSGVKDPAEPVAERASARAVSEVDIDIPIDDGPPEPLSPPVTEPPPVAPSSDSPPSMSRKLAPPPKPRRDSGAVSRPPSARPPDEMPRVDPFTDGALKAPATPNVAFTADDVFPMVARDSEPDTIVKPASPSAPPLGTPPPIPKRRSNPGLAADEPAAPANVSDARSPSDPALGSAQPKPVAAPPRPAPSGHPHSESPSGAPAVESAPAVAAAPDNAPAIMAPALLAERAEAPPVSAPPPSSSSAIFAMRIIAVGDAARAKPAPVEPGADFDPEAYPPSASRLGTGLRRSSRPSAPSIVVPDLPPVPRASADLASVAALAEGAENALPVAAAQTAAASVEPAEAHALHGVTENTEAPRIDISHELSDEDVAPDSGEKKIPPGVEELGRDDAISLLPEETPGFQPEAKTDPGRPPPPPKRPLGTPPSVPVVEPLPATSAFAGTPPPIPDPAAAKAAQRAKTRQPWWEDLFSEDFMRASGKVSDEQIRREVTFIEDSLGVAAGGVVLDLGCGAGHHAVEFASRGYGVVGYDLSLYQLALAADVAQERSQKINFLQGDMREMAFEEMFDGVFCWNTTFGYFEEDKNLAVAQRVFKALRPGGMFLIDVLNRDFAAASAPCTVWYEGDACVCMDDMSVDYISSRLRVKRSIILDDGRTKESLFSLRLYSLHELGKLLHEVGFRVTEASGHPATPGVFFGPNSPRIIMLAQRP
ncbi:MAG: methyltransferase domain-containing protein [Pseudomonadota bacterium]